MEIEWLPLGQSLADKHRAAELRWRGKPPGIPSVMAAEFLAAIKSGKTIQMLTSSKKEYGTAFVSSGRFKAHCNLNPDWAREVRTLSNENTTRLMGARGRKLTHCKHGHLLSRANVYVRSNGTRKCVTCQKRIEKTGRPADDEQIKKVTAALNAGKTISQICWGMVGGKKSDVPIVGFRKLKRYRQLNPDFEIFLRSATADNNMKGQRRRYQPDRVRIEIVRSQNNEFKAIMDLTPAYLPPDVRNDIAQSIFLALFEGSLRRDQVTGRVQKFVADHNRMFPTKFAKFGDSRLVSLDEVMFEDGSTTRGDTVSRGLWD